jgi:hypothetical protein
MQHVQIAGIFLIDKIYFYQSPESIAILYFEISIFHVAINNSERSFQYHFSDAMY